MSDYYQTELLHLIDKWTPEQLESYIESLEERIKNIKEQVTLLRALRKRRMRNRNLKENGPRDGR